MHGDQARLKVFTRRGLDVLATGFGPNSPEPRKWQDFVARPLSQSFFERALRDWQTGANDIPTHLSREAFENWLWREDH
jgi:hypothetical protein